MPKAGRFGSCDEIGNHPILRNTKGAIAFPDCQPDIASADSREQTGPNARKNRIHRRAWLIIGMALMSHSRHCRLHREKQDRMARVDIGLQPEKTVLGQGFGNLGLTAVEKKAHRIRSDIIRAATRAHRRVGLERSRQNERVAF